jgi:hypothetical protein
MATTVSPFVTRALYSLWGRVTVEDLKASKDQLVEPTTTPAPLNMNHLFIFSRRFEAIDSLRRYVMTCYGLNHIDDNLTIDQLIQMLMEA